eukprot:7160918-Alexandrium_andersonii.AAC.1
MRTETWRKANGKLEQRAGALADTVAPPAARAILWNSYCVTVLPYPAQTCPPGPEFGSRPDRCLASVFRLA